MRLGPEQFEARDHISEHLTLFTVIAAASNFFEAAAAFFPFQSVYGAAGGRGGCLPPRAVRDGSNAEVGFVLPVEPEETTYCSDWSGLAQIQYSGQGQTATYNIPELFGVTVSVLALDGDSCYN